MDTREGIRKFLLLCCTVFFAFLTIGLPLAALPLQVHDVLGYSAFVVGIVMGLQSFATVFTRHTAGARADSVGPKPTVQTGLLVCVFAGIAYLLSAHFTASPSLSLSLLTLGRIILGLGESLLITGALTWGIGLVGVPNTGKVMAWNGIAMYGALSFGAPIGLYINQHYSFEAMMCGVIFCPVISLLITRFIPNTARNNALSEREPFLKVIRLVWIYGLGMAMGTIGFGALSAFIALYFRAKGFGDAGTAMLIFGFCYVSVRVFGGHLPDRTGGRSVGLISLFVEMVGQALLWLAPTVFVAYIGIALTGFGFSLVFPAFGVQANKHIPAHSRGSALGAFFAFFDLALGTTGPLAGAVASLLSYSEVYLLGTLACLVGFAISFFSSRDRT